MVNVFKYAMKRRIPPRAGTAGNPPMQQLLHPFKVVILFALPHFSNHYHFAHHGMWVVGMFHLSSSTISFSVNAADEADSEDITS
mmetsp:Transcript_26162/g.39547  ORF Transcript_26162/g.39547 Transcript_26162/m.39547 type:complete len:85 (-) Transcript_26162:179-433(-)